MVPTSLPPLRSSNVSSTPLSPLSPLSSFSMYTSSSSISSSSSSSCFLSSKPSYRPCSLRVNINKTHLRTSSKSKGLKVNCSVKSEPLKVMISGAPASGKGTLCELIVQKFGLVHISTGDLLRAEVSSGTEIGNKAKEYMNAGRLVPDEIVTAMVKARLSREDAKEKGWLLDGYSRSATQAQSLEELKIRPDIYVVLDVPDEILIDRCIGRRLDPVTGKIYHLKNFPPETEEIRERLVTRPDDSEEKVKRRLEVYKQNAETILSTYSNIMNKIDGNRPKDEIFAEIESLLSEVQKDKEKLKLGKPTSGNDSLLNQSSSSQVVDNWRGIPTRLNNIPHSREIRKYFYNDVLQATQRAINDGRTRLKVEINIPELNPEMDVYRIGTLMELVRVVALSFADDGKRVKVCVQGSMGEGALVGMPLQLAGTRAILEFMDWGDYGAIGTFIKIGSIGAKDVDEQDDMFILVAPQNAVGNCIIDDLRAMTDAAGKRPVILINPRLKDLPGSSGIMQTMGRNKRLEYAASFESCYFFRLLYYAGTQYPIMGAIRMSYPYPYELYKRVDEPSGKEKYVALSTFPKRPNPDEINDAFIGKPRNQTKKESGIWGFLSSIF
ncbi:adenylate kinase 5, chloroplastic isoform X2 [Morus notabilis]|uniref:adenylate kinase 5, chloroplastic isoform X2 n=1 Tax=Morus notabilis TaxID=981085 RepID=UPI000CED7C26|nr:adenylate kinase 5, chloroplastic isoform X2 [Morus notabilis]